MAAVVSVLGAASEGERVVETLSTRSARRFIFTAVMNDKHMVCLLETIIIISIHHYPSIKYQ